MTIEEYLKVINGVSLDQVLTSDAIANPGFIDIIPTDQDSKWIEPARFSVAGAYLISRKRVITPNNEEKVLELVTPLKDDLSMHLDDYKTVEETLIHTIAALKQIQESHDRIAEVTGVPQPDLKPRILILEAFLAKVKAESMDKPSETMGF